MKTLLLVRHADSDWAKDYDDDHQRQLNFGGKVAAKFMAKRLLNEQLVPEIVVCSTALRAASTAKLFNETLMLSPQKIILLPALYLAEPTELHSQLEKLDNQYDRAMIIAHNPGLTSYAEYLTGDEVAQLPTCSIYGIQMDVTRWDTVGQESGKCIFFDYPQKHLTTNVSSH